MKSRSQLFVLVGALCSLMGCNGGGISSPRGSVCRDNFNPLPVSLTKGAEKVALEASAGEISQYPGKYDYVGAELFYQNKATGVQIHLADVKNRKGEWKPSTVCVSGFKVDSAPLQFDFTGLKDMTVTSAGKMTFSVREYSVEFADLQLKKPDFRDGDSSRFEAPSKVYEGQVTEYAFYKMSTKAVTDFQSRAQFTNGTETVSAVIKYKRDPKAAPAP